MTGFFDGDRPRRSLRRLAIVLFAVLWPATAPAQSAIQETRDDTQNLIVKDVGDDQWVITYDKRSRSVSGIVIDGGGGPTQFVDCSPAGETLDDVSLRCFEASPCTASPCRRSDWRFAALVTLPRPFLFPPGTPPPTVVPPGCADVSGDWDVLLLGDCHDSAQGFRIEQTNCRFDGGWFSGEIRGRAISFDLVRDVRRLGQRDPCTLSVKGVAVASQEGIGGTYEGTIACCPGRIVRGTLAAARSREVLP